MNLEDLKSSPPWDWPPDAADVLSRAIGDRETDEEDRLVALKLAGDPAAVNDTLVAAMLDVIVSAQDSIEVRSQAAISLGPVLEFADTDGFDDPDEVPIRERTFDTVVETLQKLYTDADVPNPVRRRILEASVRAPRDWHRGAVRAAYRCDDEDWNLTAVFAMRWIRGFDEEIVEALRSDNKDIHYEAVCAAGAWEIDAAWPHVSALIHDAGTARPLLLAAIDATASIRPDEAGELLADLADSDDEELAEAVQEALAMAGAMHLEDDDEPW